MSDRHKRRHDSEDEEDFVGFDDSDDGHESQVRSKFCGVFPENNNNITGCDCPVVELREGLSWLNRESLRGSAKDNGWLSSIRTSCKRNKIPTYHNNVTISNPRMPLTANASGRACLHPSRRRKQVWSTTCSPRRSLSLCTRTGTQWTRVCFLIQDHWVSQSNTILKSSTNLLSLQASPSNSAGSGNWSSVPRPVSARRRATCTTLRQWDVNFAHATRFKLISPRV